MGDNEQQLYVEVANTWRHFAAWREKALAGYLTILAAFGFALSKTGSVPFKAALLLGGMGVSFVFWILDVRSNQLLNACQTAGASLEGSKGAFGALASVRSTPRVWLTYSRAMDVLVGAVMAACGGGAVMYLARLWKDRSGLLWLGAVAAVVGAVLIYGLHSMRTADASRSRADDSEHTT